MSADQILEITREESGENSQKKYWGETTDPREHNPRKFRYLTYSTSEMARKAMTLPSLLVGEKMSDVDMFMNPDDLKDKKILNMSLIDQDHLDTFYGAGYLVRVPRRNIKGTYETDAGILSVGAETQEIIDAEDLLNASVPGSHNEVVADVISDAGQIEIVGVFYKVSEKGRPLDQITAKKMEQHAHSHGWPIIKIVENSGYEKESFTSADQRFEINMDNKRFVLDYSDSQEIGFVSFDDVGYQTFPSRKEMWKIFEKYRKEIGDLELKVLKKYTEALNERRKPEIEYDENGQIKRVVIVPVDDEQTKYVLRVDGECDRVLANKLDLETRRLNAGIIDPYTYQQCLEDYQYPMSGDEVLRSLAEIEDTLSAEEYKKLLEIFGDETLKKKIDRRAQAIYAGRMKEEVWGW